MSKNKTRRNGKSRRYGTRFHKMQQYGKTNRYSKTQKYVKIKKHNGTRRGGTRSKAMLRAKHSEPRFRELLEKQKTKGLTNSEEINLKDLLKRFPHMPRTQQMSKLTNYVIHNYGFYTYSLTNYPQYRFILQPKNEFNNTEEPNMGNPNMEEPNMEEANMEEPNMEEPNMEEPNMEEPNNNTAGGAYKVAKPTMIHMTKTQKDQILKLNLVKDVTKSDPDENYKLIFNSFKNNDFRLNNDGTNKIYQKGVITGSDDNAYGPNVITSIYNLNLLDLTGKNGGIAAKDIEKVIPAPPITWAVLNNIKKYYNDTAGLSGGTKKKAVWFHLWNDNLGGGIRGWRDGRPSSGPMNGTWLNTIEAHLKYVLRKLSKNPTDLSLAEIESLKYDSGGSHNNRWTKISNTEVLGIISTTTCSNMTGSADPTKPYNIVPFYCMQNELCIIRNNSTYTLTTLNDLIGVGPIPTILKGPPPDNDNVANFKHNLLRRLTIDKCLLLKRLASIGIAIPDGYINSVNGTGFKEIPSAVIIGTEPALYS